MAKKKAGPRGFSDEIVKERTGKSWKQWFAILDQWGAKGKGHPAIARYLNERHDVTSWWCQSITVRYEWERGLRKK